MSPELDQALVRDFPSLYRSRDLPPQYSPMYWGFACGDGWEPLIRRLSEKLEPLGVVASQVKEKFGTLRFYIEPTDFDAKEAYALIDAAEAESKHTCEECGLPGKLRGWASGRRWIRTLCDDCHSTEPK